MIAPIFLALVAGAADRVDTELEASVDDALERVSIRARIRYTPSVDLDAVPIVLEAERYRAPPELTPAELREAFPRGLSSGGFSELRIELAGHACDPLERGAFGADGARVVSCPARVAAGETIELAVAAVLEVPERYGAFGRVDRALTLAGGWFPRPARLGEAPPSGPWRARVELPGSATAVIGEAYRPSRGEGARRVVTASGEGGSFPLVLRPASAYALSIAEGRARFLTGPASAHQRATELPTLSRELLLAVEDGLRFADAELALPRPTVERPLVLIEAPLRHALTESAEGVVFVSDRAFRMLEVQRFLRFHRLPLLREVFAALARRALGPELRGRALSGDVIGAASLERYVEARYGADEDAFDVLKIVSFIPSIDQLLYAPDLAFAGAYFRNVPEAHPLRPDFIDGTLGVGRGKYVYEKLRDELGGARARAVVERAAAGLGLIAAIEEGWPEGAARFLATWLGPHPRVRYALGATRTAPDPAGGVRAEVEILRRGDAIAEPVTVELRGEGGEARRVTASSTTAPSRTVTATLASALELVLIDPDRRLVETPDDEAPDPRYLHRSTPEWKVLLNNFNVLLAASEGSLETAIDLGIARRHDVRWSFGVRGELASEAISAGARAAYFFGPRVTGARLAHWVGLSGEAAYLRPGFAGEEGGAALLVGASYGYDDRSSAWAPETGTAVRFGVSGQHIFGELPEGATPDALSVSARALGQWRLGARHQLSLRGAAAAYLVGRPQSQLLFSLGGRGNVRGYAQAEQLGRVRGMLSGEWLHPLLTGMNLDFFEIAWVSGIDGALYADVAAIGDSLEDALAGPAFADVGYGLRAYIDYFGVRPGVFALDVAMPLVPRRGARERAGLAVYLTFAQSFSGL